MKVIGHLLNFKTAEQSALKRIIIHPLLLIGITIFVLLLILIMGYLKEKKQQELLYQRSFVEKAQYLAHFAEENNTNHTIALEHISHFWENNIYKTEDEYFCVIDSAGCLVAHSKYPLTTGQYVGMNKLKSENGVVSSLMELVRLHRNYVGRYTSSNGEQQIAAFVYIPELNWEIGIHRSYKEFSKEVNRSLKNYFITVILIVGIVFPLSIILLVFIFNRIFNERKKAGEQLVQSEKNYRETIEFFPEAIYECDLTGKLILVNKAAYLKFGYTEEDFVNGLNAFDMIVDEEKNKGIINFKKVIEENVHKINEYTAKHKDGSTFPVLIYSSLVLSGGKPTGIRGVIVDITDRKLTELEIMKQRQILEVQVKERTSDLEQANAELIQKNKELEEYNQLFIGREFRIKELKDKIKELEAKLKYY